MDKNMERGGGRRGGGERLKIRFEQENKMTTYLVLPSEDQNVSLHQPGERQS